MMRIKVIWKMPSAAGNSKETSGGCKRSRPEGVIVGADGPQEKRRKMDRSLTQQCSSLPKELKKRPVLGRVFNQPLDPKALKKIHDNMKKPLDLGAIKSKLEKNDYLGIEETVADFKLMFSNTVLCNPPAKDVHKTAEEVKEFFETRRKSLEKNWNHKENLKVEHGKILSARSKVVNVSKQSCPKTQPSRKSSNLRQKSKQSEEKIVKVPLNARAAKNCVKLTSQMCKSDVPHSNGVVSALNDKNVALVPATDAASRDRLLTPIVDAQMSPKKALRAAMLKSRFADTILKAQLKIKTALLDQGNKADDPVRMQQDKEKLEIRLREAKAKVRAAEAAEKYKAEVELKKQRQREREAARISLQKMEKTAGIELNLEIFKELDILSGSSLSCGNVLHQLGLFIKQEYLEDDEDEAALEEENEKIRAAEAAAKMKAEVELKKQREREREAARISLQKMEKTAGIELNLEIFQELDILSGSSLSCGNVLHQLGLFFKHEYLDDDEDEAALEEENEKIRAAEAATKMKAEVELKKQREREREAARIALQKMEKTAGIELNLEIFKELQILSGSSLSRGNTLHHLGLFITDKYLEDDDYETVLDEDVEEGEIVS